MTHKFDIKDRGKLDNENRRKILPPHKTLLELGLSEGNSIADIGCGIGYFTFPAASIVGSNGMVYAIDISAEMLKEIEEKIETQGITSIKTILSEENNLKLEDNKVDFAFISNVLHEANELEKLIVEIKRIIKPGGKIAIIEWQKIQSDFGPPVEHRLDNKFLQSELEKQGFKNSMSSKIGEYFYTITSEK